MKLKDVKIGKIDGKYDYLSPKSNEDQLVFDAFLVPKNIQVDKLNHSDRFFVAGFRGTGKTSLLRWFCEKKAKENSKTAFVLFKSDLTESQKMQLSQSANDGVVWADLKPDKMGIAQDFKDAWTWFICHKIGEILKEDNDCVEDYNGDARKIRRLLGIEKDSTIEKWFGVVPKLKGAKVTVRADIEFFSAEFEGDFIKSSEQKGEIYLSDINRKIVNLINGLSFRKPIYIFFDELEAFFINEEQHRRDLIMVRDLIFSIAKLNGDFHLNDVPVHVFGAVRTEVLDAMGALGQEVNRVIHDKGFLISWHHEKRSINHPLIEMIGRKLAASEGLDPNDNSLNVFFRYFDKSVNGDPIENFLLDSSFYKPRDLVWRLSLVQELFPESEKFSQELLERTEVEYSRKMWDEVRYELSAIYSDQELKYIERLFAGRPATFDLLVVQEQAAHLSKLFPVARRLFERREVELVLEDLYRIGAIGNSFRVGTAGNNVKNRWIFRGDQTPILEKRMVVHPALIKSLSVVAQRRRGRS